MTLPPFVAPVPPVPPGSKRPLWSVMIPAYMAGEYIEDTLEGVLAQDPGPDLMQIEVVDDASDDAVQTIVEIVGRGRVDFYQQPRNVGHIDNFQTCLARARGEIVHLLHGDDYVLPGFYEALGRGLAAAPEAGAAFCRSIYVDEDGREVGRLEAEQPQAGLLADALGLIATEQRIMTPSMVVRRSVYEAVGGFDRRLSMAEDWEMWVRIVARFPVWYEPQPFACYRMHGSSNTGRNVRTARDAAFNRRAIEIFADHLPAERRDQLVDGARRLYAMSALQTARQLRVAGDFPAARAQAMEALKLSPGLGTAARAARALLLPPRRR